MKKPLKIIILILVILLLGAAITAGGAFWPVWVATYEDIYDLNFGFPLKFAEETTTLVFNDVYFPRYMAPQYFNDTFETTVYIDLLIYSIIINLVISAAICLGIYFINKQYRKKHPKKPRNKRKKDEYVRVFDD